MEDLRERKAIEPINISAAGLIAIHEQPAEIIEFEGAKYRKVEREAREGDVVIFHGVKNSISTDSGKMYKVINGCEYIGNTGSARMVYGWQGSCPNPDVYELIEQPKSPNQQRAQIIEKAKKFVEEQFLDGYHGVGKVVLGHFYGGHNTVEFVVNEHKRTVVALLRPAYVGRNVDKGIAKCHPNNVFNEHIGKAIALGRALGLDVSEFEQAVQPTEFEVGQTIKWDVTGSKYDILNIDGHGYNFYSYLLKDESGMLGYENLKDLATIINDTNAIYKSEVV